MDALKSSMLKTIAFVVLGLGLSGCQIGYLFKTAKNHLTMMSHRMSIDEALQKPELSESDRQKLRLAREAHDFALHEMHLKENDNYTTYIPLEKPYVSWVVSAAPRWKLEHHQWSYPFVGRLPYRGFATEDDAKEEQAELEKQNLDTYLRGVSAYSTLGWFKDSVLSSMLRYQEHDLVNTIIHETTHVTLFISGSADFNERLAVFVGNKGMEQFYQRKEGVDSPTLKKVREENEDDRRFSDFIGPQLKSLQTWYESLPAEQRSEEGRQKRLRQIQDDFKTELLPSMKTKSYARFPETALNNARLLYFKTYMQDLSDFEKLFALMDQSWVRFVGCAKTLEKKEKPQEALKELLQSITDDKAPAACRSTAH